jgi:hypothetical protein
METGYVIMVWCCGIEGDQIHLHASIENNIQFNELDLNVLVV